MFYRFGDFQFDSTQLLLTKKGKLIQLSDKSAALLKAFLQCPEQIHSKAQLLELGWPDRVVSEQVIFQNISQLRAVFGDDSIKTFAKKGYQWQLPVESITRENVEQKTLEREEGKGKSSARILPLLLIAVVFVIVGNFALVNRSNSLATDNSVQLLSKSNSTVQALDTVVSVQDLFDSPNVTWASFHTRETDLLVATKVYQLARGVLLRYAVQGQQRGLHSYIVADNSTEAEIKFKTFVEAISRQHYFTAATKQQALAVLSSLEVPAEVQALVDVQLAQLYFQLDDYELSNAILENMLSHSVSPVQIGLLHLHKAKIALWEQSYEQARNSLAIAQSQLAQDSLGHLQAQVFIQLAWLHLVDQNFLGGMSALNKAANLARVNQEPLLEVTSYLNQAFMASKLDKLELSYTQLDQAKQLMALHDLSREHMPHLLYKTVWLASNQEAAARIYEDVLQQKFTPRYENYFYAALEQLNTYYLQTGQWQKANETIKSWQRASFQLLTQSRIAIAKQDLNEGRELAREAHRQALLLKSKKDALDSALLLFEYADEEDKKQYRDFIFRRGTKRWLSQNSNALARLGLTS